ncbi:MAG: cytochrome c-type biogenesis protein CcmH [Cellvibrio sp. 79]|nr:MAG: cytochrome c-type biogenesis protein CcmH [Cellvibrio sp. 79]
MYKTLIKVFAAFSLLFTVQTGFAAIEVHEFDNEVDRQRYQTFIDEMRCPKCQNQNLAGTNSPVAMDLRRELELMIKDGKSDQEIVSFMVERYGEFILYRPRLTPATMLLWSAPVLLLVFGALLLLLIVRKRRRLATEVDTGLSQQERARLDALLRDNPESKSINKNNQEKNK